MEVAVVSKMKSPAIAEEYIPETSYELIDHLAEIYRPRCILPNETPEEAHRFAGAVDLVNQLLDWKANEMGIETPHARPRNAGSSTAMEIPMLSNMDD